MLSAVGLRAALRLHTLGVVLHQPWICIRDECGIISHKNGLGQIDPKKERQEGSPKLLC